MQQVVLRQFPENSWPECIYRGANAHCMRRGSGSVPEQMMRNLPAILAWLFACAVAVFLASMFSTAAIVDGTYIPVGFDSFYHARRIIDAAVGDRGFYQFDPMIYAPEGELITWPWAFDYLLAMLLKLAMSLYPSMEPMAFLAQVPVFWVTVNITLFALIVRRLDLHFTLFCVALLAFSVSPLTQAIHGTGRLDHHFAEMSFMLLTTWLGLRFFSCPQKSSAVPLGIALGFATAFHNGLFILQIPLLASFLLCWIKRSPGTAFGSNIAVAMLISSVAAALPSPSFRALAFEFWTLSWFHVYVAFGSASVLVFVSRRAFSPASAALLLAFGLVLLLPPLGQIAHGTSFISGKLEIIANVDEVQSPVGQILETGGAQDIAFRYGYLIFLAPVLLALSLVFATRSNRSEDIFLHLSIAFGLTLSMLQYRFHPFGSWALISATILIYQQFSSRITDNRIMSGLCALGLMALAFQPPLHHQIFKVVQSGGARDYAVSRSLYARLARACDGEPGIVLSHPNDGHPIRYHTACSVFINSFLIKPEHKAKLAQMNYYFSLSPEEFRREPHYFRYLFIRLGNTHLRRNGNLEPNSIDAIKQSNARLSTALAFAKEAPEGFELIAAVRDTADPRFFLAAVYRVDPTATVPAPATPLGRRSASGTTRN